MRMGVLGVNHKLAALAARERLALVCHRWIHSPFTRKCQAPCVVLSTCNRTEVYFSSEELAVTHTEILATLREEVEEEFDQKLYTYFGGDCFRHLMRVTAGLDSAIRGETEIQGQVALAYQAASKSERLPMELHYLFQKSLKVGKQIRACIPFARGIPELQDAILHLGALFFASPHQARILLIGASSINQALIRHFRKRGFNNLTLCNRTLKHSQDMCQQHQLQLLPWSLKAQWASFDWVLCATKAPQFLLTRDDLCHLKRPQLLMDLSVPRNIDPELEKAAGITLYHIDAIQATVAKVRVDRLDLFDEAEEWAEKAAARYIELFYAKQQRKQAIGYA